MDIPFSFSSHTSYDPPALHDKLRSAAFVASISEFDRQRLIERGGQDLVSCIHVVRCGIPLDEWPFRSKLALNDPVRLLSVGALIEKKGHDVLIEASSFLKTAGVRFHCEVIGEGPLRNRLHKLIVDLDLQDVVKLRGALPQSQVREALYASDVFVLGCKSTVDDDMDGIPVSLMEAMAAGVPVVSTRISGIPELVVDGRHGVLVKPGSARDLADAIENLLRSKQRLGQMPAVARARIEKVFDQQKEAEKLADLFMFSQSRTATAIGAAQRSMGRAG